MAPKEEDLKAEPEEVTDEMLELSLKSKKKKKKSKKTEDNIEDDGADDSNIKEDVGDGSISFSNNDGGDEPAEDDDFGAMDLTKKKKKKKKQKESDDMDDDDVIIDDDADESNEPRSSLLAGGALPWEGSDRDYTYEEMLERVYSILNDNNPMLRGEKKRYVLKPPEVMREGTKKSVFVNFTEICKLMHRPVDHVLAFLLTELGTSGSLDGSQRLIVKGRFQPRSFEHVLRRYIVEYVSCHSCRSPDTTLTKESANRLYFLHCNSCSATRSVAPIKQGYMAQIGRRRRM